MEMRRSRIIATAIVLGLLGAAIPVAAMAYVSWAIALNKELAVLTRSAEQAYLRASRTFDDARKALKAADAADLPRCSEEHIRRMRMMTVNTPSIEEVGYFEGGVLRCTSWGRSDEGIAKSHVDYVTPDGMEITLRVQPAISHGRRMTAMHFGSHNALVVPSRFVDILVDDAISLAVLNEDGMLLDGLNGPDPALVRSVVGKAGSGVAGNTMFAVSRGESLVAVATEPKANLAAKVRSEQLLLLPIGAFIAAFVVGTIVWLSRKRLSPLADLEVAVRKREFIVHYQPIVELKSGICVGAEALVRWQRPDGSLVRPDLFIPLAEETGLIMPITDQVVDAVIADLKTMLLEDRTVHIAINLCAADMASGRILDVIDGRLRGTGIRHEQIWLEATERGFIDIEAARTTLQIARQRGHSVAIDDFGTGYSSLQYLQELPLDALKIDKSFVDTAGIEAATSSVTPYIIGMAKELRLFTVAEGIETERQAEYLKEHDVDFGQGWLFSKPLPAAEFIKFHRQSKARHGSAPERIRASAA